MTLSVSLNGFILFLKHLTNAGLPDEDHKIKVSSVSTLSPFSAVYPNPWHMTPFTRTLAATMKRCSSVAGLTNSSYDCF